MEMVLKALRTERIWEGKRGAWDRGWWHPHSSGRRRRGASVREKWQERRAWLLMFNVTETQKELETQERPWLLVQQNFRSVGRRSECTV